MIPLKKAIGGLAAAVALSLSGAGLSACGSPSDGDSRAVRALDEVTTPAPAATTSPTPPAPTATPEPTPTATPPARPKPKPKPKPATTKKPKPKKTPKQAVYYKNCDAVRDADAAPIHEGDPGYSRKLDRDGDGIGCED
ncbi:excalibur calcium-binding domain-containing protein [Actinoplanes sp. NPDC049265]|uniref:excalibur calcium-binding domain-containing protein n=1 Tax=Actinoplanes sp. NPDC049265 TaxID=3363902 RepID=UPI00371395EA